MKPLKLLAVISLLTSSAFAQKPGFFVTAGGGLAQMNTGSFTVYNPVADAPGEEPLATTDKGDTVTVARLTVGYNLTENWALQVSYAEYGAGEVSVAFPQYPGMAWAPGEGPDTYHRHVLRYKPTSVTLMPSYTHAISNRSRIIAGAGINYTSTVSRFETTSTSGATAGTSPAPQSASYPKKTNRTLGYVLSLGVDRLITDSLSIQLTGNYTNFKAKVPSSPWAARSKSSVNIDAYGVELALAWHW